MLLPSWTVYFLILFDKFERVYFNNKEPVVMCTFV